MIIINPLSITYELSPKALKELSCSILLLLAEADGVELRLDVTTGVEKSGGYMYFGFDKIPSKCSSLSATLQEKLTLKTHTNHRVCSKLKDFRSKYEYSCMRLYLDRNVPSVGKWRRNSANSLLVAPSKPRVDSTTLK